MIDRYSQYKPVRLIMPVAFILLFVSSVILVHAENKSAEKPEFVTGVSITNKDSRSYRLEYEFTTVTSKLCLVARPTRAIIKGIEPSGFRDDSQGLTILNHEYNGIESSIKAVLSGKTTIYCLCTDKCVVSVEGNDKISNIGNGKTIVIENGKARLE